MTQVADQLGVHVATVSRAVAGKYIQCPRGVFPLRKFFSGGTQTEDGQDMSWEAIRAAMQDVVDEEDKTRPLSDEAISKAMKERGYRPEFAAAVTVCVAPTGSTYRKDSR